MRFLDHIARCNDHDMSKYRPFVVDAETVGHVRHDNADHLARFTDIFTVSRDAVALSDELDSYEARTRAVDGVMRHLADDGVVTGWRGELYPVGGSWGGPHAFEVERAAAALLGIRAYGVHVNGYVRADEGLKMWVGVRADDRPVCPGQLDNMIAGGQPVALGLKDNVIKEAGEEAGVPRDIARTAIPVGAISYVMDDTLGLKPDLMYCWDLELPADFIPVNTDGEIAEFRLMPAEEVMEIVDSTTDFKFNCNLVNIDFFIRHGVLPPEHPDYEALLSGLHG